MPPFKPKETLVQQVGRTSREETALEIAHQIRVEEDHKRFLDSTEGVQAANREKVALFGELKRRSDKFNKEQSEREFLLHTSGFSLRVTWWFELRNSGLYIDLFKGLLSLRGNSRYREPELLKKMQYDFDRNAAGELGWRRLDKERQFFFSAQLADECVEILLGQIRYMKLRG